MSHMVIFRTPEGKPGYQPAETVEDAVSVVERLRNEDGVENVRIFRLEELAFEYRPYYKVELAGASGHNEESTSTSTPTQIFSVSSSSDHRDEGEAAEADDAEHGGDHPEAEMVSDEAAAFDESDSLDAPSNDAPAQPPWAAPPPPAPVIEQPAEVGGFGENRDESDDEFSGQRRGLFGR